MKLMKEKNSINSFNIKLKNIKVRKHYKSKKRKVFVDEAFSFQPHCPVWYTQACEILHCPV